MIHTSICVMCGEPISLCSCEPDLYEIARWVSMPGERVQPFLKVLEMCGYELRKKKSPPPAAPSRINQEDK
jgi:hypothetical protein